MTRRIPITKISKLDDLNNDEVIEGYMDGKSGDTEPGDNRSYSYWHGWRNGAADGGHKPIDAAQRALAKDMVASWKK